MRCYECGRVVAWLNVESRCWRCTRIDPLEPDPEPEAEPEADIDETQSPDGRTVG
jgi:hypothetical protein